MHRLPRFAGTGEDQVPLVAFFESLRVSFCQARQRSQHIGGHLPALMMKLQTEALGDQRLQCNPALQIGRWLGSRKRASHVEEVVASAHPGSPTICLSFQAVYETNQPSQICSPGPEPHSIYVPEVPAAVLRIARLDGCNLKLRCYLRTLRTNFCRSLPVSGEATARGRPQPTEAQPQPPACRPSMLQSASGLPPGGIPSRWQLSTWAWWGRFYRPRPGCRRRDSPVV